MFRSLLAAMQRASVVIVLVVGLVVTTPVVCVCGPADHGGQALHSLLPHTHEHVGETVAHVHEGADDASLADALTDDPEFRTVRLTAQNGGAAGALTAAGAIGLALAAPLQLTSVDGERLPLPALLIPAGPNFEPPGPPPRQAA